MLVAENTRSRPQIRCKSCKKMTRDKPLNTVQTGTGGTLGKPYNLLIMG